MGSFSCLCYPGYSLATLGDTQECQGKSALGLGWAQENTSWLGPAVGVEEEAEEFYHCVTTGEYQSRGKGDSTLTLI